MILRISNRMNPFLRVYVSDYHTILSFQLLILWLHQRLSSQNQRMCTSLQLPVLRAVPALEALYSVTLLCAPVLDHAQYRTFPLAHATGLEKEDSGFGTSSENKPAFVSTTTEYITASGNAATHCIQCCTRPIAIRTIGVALKINQHPILPFQPRPSQRSPAIY
ncbi:uncharacterized protein LACBIDRAFT_326684 [Laccaria bicolor S238N-H82]|uniref:Predicted protein n=1 Tax=Laccaria bicolor (strain S238N-H82 / ATCC MYA-4686) TaxID=486041 RepID=B0D846_LACBS|nr:uncharacterized protein LACBIDRAFT_326684 [Laccaria bicolor S238N-H82]EDR09012.1 predicted protein [Laccaria bicolor S238N-H82]|eukprot:XP_001880325.1 predicted protein [Laccaria bicolor S238N-H82]